MSSSPSPKQWIIVIVVNIVVSAITTLLVVRALMAPGSATGTGIPAAAPAGAAAAEATQPPAPAAIATTPALTATSDVTATDSTTPTAPVATAPAGESEATAADATAPERATATPGVTGTSVRISTVLFPGQLSREVVVLVNEGDTTDLTGWVLASSSGIAYTFGNVTLLKDSFINLHTTTGADVPTDLFWDRDEPAWESGDRLTLSNGDQTLATFTVR